MEKGRGQKLLGFFLSMQYPAIFLPVIGRYSINIYYKMLSFLFHTGYNGYDHCKKYQ